MRIFPERILPDKQKHLKSNIRKIYLYKVLFGMIFPIPIMVLFWQDNGLSLTQVMILQALFAITVVFLEVPSGYFADLVGRRKTLFIAGNSLFFAVVVCSVGHNFYHFLIAEMLFACDGGPRSTTTGFGSQSK